MDGWMERIGSLSSLFFFVRVCVCCLSCLSACLSVSTVCLSAVVLVCLALPVQVLFVCLIALFVWLGAYRLSERSTLISCVYLAALCAWFLGDVVRHRLCSLRGSGVGGGVFLGACAWTAEAFSFLFFSSFFIFCRGVFSSESYRPKRFFRGVWSAGMFATKALSRRRRFYHGLVQF